MKIPDHFFDLNCQYLKFDSLLDFEDLIEDLPLINLSDKHEHLPCLINVKLHGSLRGSNVVCSFFFPLSFLVAECCLHLFLAFPWRSRQQCRIDTVFEICTAAGMGLSHSREVDHNPVNALLLDQPVNKSRVTQADR